MTFDAQTILPPGAELMLFTLVLNVDGREKGDHVLTVSCGSRGGPGAAETLVFPQRTISDALTHYTQPHTNEKDRQASEHRIEGLLKQCLQRT
jgi:hypothetical protein